MPRRELSETEKALRLEQVVERKMLAAAVRLLDPHAQSLVAQRVYQRLVLGAAYPTQSAQSLGPTALRATRTIDARELPFAKATCDPGFDVGGGGEGGA